MGVVNSKALAIWQNAVDATNNDAELFVVLCNDVLLEALQHGNRRQLVKLQRIGRRFHKMIEAYFRAKPYLRLNFRLAPGDGFEHFALAPLRKQPRGRKLTEFPCFLRFDSVVLIYDFGNYFNLWMPPLFLKQRVFLQNLRVLKPALVDSNLFRFTARVICQRSQSANSSFYFNGHFSVHFKDHFAVLEHLRNKLLPICGSSRRYEFRIEILSCDDRHNAAATDVIESLLQMPQIAVRSNVTIDVLVCCHNIDTLSLLPVEAIAKWLNQTSDEATGVNDQKNTKKQEKFLSIHMLTIQNEKEMVGRLTEAFKEAVVPTSPFTLLLFKWFRTIGFEEQMLTNKATNEEFSVGTTTNYDNTLGIMSHVLEIKRAVRT